jgi:arsenate reductase (thioredoxin)
MTTVLFACVHNAGRSKMAEAFFNAAADPARARAISAGTQPAARAHAEVAAAMAEIGLDLEGAAPRYLGAELARSADVLITMGCGEECPVVPGLRRLDWALADPKGGSPDRVRAIRDEIRARVAELIRANGWQREAS